VDIKRLMYLQYMHIIIIIMAINNLIATALYDQSGVKKHSGNIMQLNNNQ